MLAVKKRRLASFDVKRKYLNPLGLPYLRGPAA